MTEAKSNREFIRRINGHRKKPDEVNPTLESATTRSEGNHRVLHLEFANAPTIRKADDDAVRLDEGVSGMTHVFKNTKLQRAVEVLKQQGYEVTIDTSGGFSCNISTSITVGAGRQNLDITPENIIGKINNVSGLSLTIPQKVGPIRIATIDYKSPKLTIKISVPALNDGQELKPEAPAYKIVEALKAAGKNVVTKPKSRGFVTIEVNGIFNFKESTAAKRIIAAVEGVEMPEERELSDGTVWIHAEKIMRPPTTVRNFRRFGSR